MFRRRAEPDQRSLVAVHPAQVDPEDLESATRGPYGIRVCHNSENATVDIVFVHGLTGNRERTWTDKQSKVFWPQDLLPKDIPDSRILSYGYDANVVNFLSPAGQNRIAHHANNLASDLAQLRDNTDTSARPLIFVAHSLGGLVCENTLLVAEGSAEDHIRKISSSTKAFAFLGVPHCGSDLAKWAALLGNVVNLVKRTDLAIVQVLRPESEVLAIIQQNFHGQVRRRGREAATETQITCFHEELPVIGIGLIVPQHSAILPGYTPISIPANHVDMTKFKASDERGYRAVSGELKRWVREIKKADMVHSSSSSDSETLIRGRIEGRNVIAGNNIRSGTWTFN